MNKWVSIGISALSDFIVTAGGAFIAIGGTTFPSTYQMTVCAVSGLIMAARGIQKTLSPPPA